MKIKICGLKRLEDIWAVNQSKPDYIGFVFAKKSRRYVSTQQAAEFRRELASEIHAVGVFVNETKENIACLLLENVIDIAQLHGQETEQDVCWIKKQTGKPVIKAVSVQTKTDIPSWLDSCADYLLLDHGAGGTGRSFDWNLARECTKPFFLAGGIGMHNITEASKTGAYAIDLSGSVETDGCKDPRKIAEIVKFVHTQL